MAIKVSIVEDSEKIRESLAGLIEGAEGLQCLSAYATGEEALRQIPLKKPDVVLMDIHLPQMSGIECAQRLKAVMPQVQVLMLTVYDDADQLFKALMAGASGYLLKRTPPGKLIEAIHEIHRGGSPMTGQMARMVVQYFNQMGHSANETAKLTPRELEILDHLAKGYRYKEIASALNISFDTVRSHLRSIYDKLHVHSRTEAVVKYMQK